ncbi:MAG: hypothetical protein ACI7YS_16360, partial [Flavobacterium sp.]
MKTNFYGLIDYLMTKVKSLLSLFFLLFTTIQYAQYTDLINSNRPGKSMSAFSVGETLFQIGRA